MFINNLISCARDSVLCPRRRIVFSPFIKMSLNHVILLSGLIVICGSQRSPYAGFRPIGFPALEVTTTPSTQNSTLGNRFGENGTTTSTTTQRLPVEALGDRELVNRLGKLPQDKQPFWFINWQALESNRNQPQSYPQRPSVFIDNFAIPVQNPVQAPAQPVNNVSQQ